MECAYCRKIVGGLVREHIVYDRVYDLPFCADGITAVLDTHPIKNIRVSDLGIGKKALAVTLSENSCMMRHARNRGQGVFPVIIHSSEFEEMRELYRIANGKEKCTPKIKELNPGVN